MRLASLTRWRLPVRGKVGCLQQYGMTAAKARVLVGRLAQLNKVLQQGAALFGFAVATPRFAGHELCTADPWVQGPGDQAPMHPNAAGDLAIALADQQAFPAAPPSPAATPARAAGQSAGRATESRPPSPAGRSARG